MASSVTLKEGSWLTIFDDSGKEEHYRINRVDIHPNGASANVTLVQKFKPPVRLHVRDLKK